MSNFLEGLAERAQQENLHVDPNTPWSAVLVPWLWLASEQGSSDRFAEAIAELGRGAFDPISGSPCDVFLNQLWAQTRNAFRRLGVNSGAGFLQWLRSQRDPMLNELYDTSQIPAPNG